MISETITPTMVKAVIKLAVDAGLYIDGLGVCHSAEFEEFIAHRLNDLLMIREAREHLENELTCVEQEDSDKLRTAVIELAQCPFPLHDYVSHETWALACKMVTEAGRTEGWNGPMPFRN